MRSPNPLVLTLFVAAVALGSVAPLEAKEAAGVRPVEDAPQATVVRGQPYSGQGTCTLGGDFAPAFAFEYFFPPDDQYYTLLEPSQCMSCPDTTKITAAHMVLWFQAICEQPVEVSIVGVSTADPACATPDPSNVIMPATTFTLQAPSINEAVDFQMAFAEPVCLTDSAFLCITINEFGQDCNSQINMPLLVAADTGCETCKFWNFYDDQGPQMDDLCLVFPPQNIGGPPVHYVETDCTCDLTPARPTSWGSLKIRYARP